MIIFYIFGVFVESGVPNMVVGLRFNNGCCGDWKARKYKRSKEFYGGPFLQNTSNSYVSF
jgi:hypothetical protein